jgi:nucleoside-diphosphate-sugar epimerase
MLNSQEVILYSHHPSRKVFEVESADYVETALGTAEEVLTRVQSLSKAKVIFTGSYWQELNGTERAPINGYALAKQLVQEYISTKFKNDHGSASLHLFDVYGPNDNRNKLIPKLIKDWKNRTVTRISNPNAIFAPIHVCDVIEAIRVESVERSTPNFHIHSISPSEILTVRDFIEQFLRIFPEAKVEIDPTQNFSSPLKPLTHGFPENWSPQIDLESGLKALRNLEF